MTLERKVEEEDLELKKIKYLTILFSHAVKKKSF